MWFHLGFRNFVGKKTHNDASCDIFVSDFKRIWYKSLSNDEVQSISQRLNPLFEAPVEKLKDLTLNLLADVKVKKEITEDNNNILVKLKSNIMNIKFQFQIMLNLGDEDMFYKEFTLPLLLVLAKIQAREKNLIKIIEDKDIEIKDYKQNYRIESNYLTTVPFSKKEFYGQESGVDIPWDNSFVDCINSELCAIEVGPQTKQEDIEMEEKSERMKLVKKTGKKETIFKDKSINQSSSSSKPCLLLDTKVIKKRKQNNSSYKIKF